uniref:Uncharacterized protein n=1 Tax=Polysiphonia sp. TaxID=1967842 RepID=A0A1Z1M3N9_9FLOR|nr:hypothetical protein [Polysiphonia sp.]
MFKSFTEKPENFINYSQGDLINYDALINNNELFKSLYELLKIGEWFTNIKSSIGASVNVLLEAALAKKFHLNSTKTLIEHVKYKSHHYLNENLSST